MKRRLVGIAAMLLFLSGSAASAEEAMRAAMGTFARIVVSDPRDNASAAIEAALDEIARLDRMMSTYRPESELSLLNSSQSFALITVSPELYAVLEQSLYYHRCSLGAFDVTVRPLVELWKQCEHYPAMEEITQTLSRVGSQHIRLFDEGRVVMRAVAGLEIDLGGIGKGFAVDRARDVLIAHGVRAAVVDLGRTLYCQGRSEDGDWEVGIAHPARPDALAAIVEVRDRAVSTSGNYEQYRVLDGTRVGHIVDPRSGYPADTGLVSVTVIAPTATAADALTTAIFVLGPEAGALLLSTMQDVEGILIFENEDDSYGYYASNPGRIRWVSPDLGEHFQALAR